MKDLIIEDIEIFSEVIEVNFFVGRKPDTEFINLSDLESFCKKEGLLTIEHAETNPLTGYSREWIERVDFDTLINNINEREYLTSIIKKYLPKVINYNQKAA